MLLKTGISLLKILKANQTHFFSLKTLFELFCKLAVHDLCNLVSQLIESLLRLGKTRITSEEFFPIVDILLNQALELVTLLLPDHFEFLLLVRKIRRRIEQFLVIFEVVDKRIVLLHLGPFVLISSLGGCRFYLFCGSDFISFTVLGLLFYIGSFVHLLGVF